MHSGLDILHSGSTVCCNSNSTLFPEQEQESFLTSTHMHFLLKAHHHHGLASKAWELGNGDAGNLQKCFPSEIVFETLALAM